MDCEVSPEWLELPADEGRVNDLFLWEGEIQKTPEGAAVRGTLSGVLVRQCVRCLQEFDDQVSIPCRAVFQLTQGESGQISRPDPTSSKSDSLEPDDEEIYPCVGNQVELAMMLREQVILTTPIQPLCRPDCLGLCQICGHNLNKGSCRCIDRDPIFQQGSIRFRVGKAKHY